MRILGIFVLSLTLLFGAGVFISQVRTDVIAVPIFIHLIQPTKQNLITDTQILEQMDILNDAVSYDGRLSFYLSGVDRTVNSNWFRAGPLFNRVFDASMKAALNKDGMKVIDVYVIGNESMALLGAVGYAPLPSNSRLDANKDGAVVWYGVFPGDTVPHELGHTLGLDDIYHAPIVGCADMMYGLSNRNICPRFSREEISAMITSFKAYRK